MASAADHGPLHHTHKMQGLQQHIYAETFGKVDERPLKTLCETSAEELIGLKKRFRWRRAEERVAQVAPTRVLLADCVRPRAQ